MLPNIPEEAFHVLTQRDSGDVLPTLTAIIQESSAGLFTMNISG